MQVKSTHTRGFTLLEVIITVIIVVLVTAIVFSALNRFNRSAALDAAAEESAALLLEARTLTLASKGGEVFGVHFATSSATLFSSDTYTQGAPDNDVLTFPTTVMISDIALSGGGSDVVFERLTGKTEQDGTVTFSLATSQASTRTITIDPAGTIAVD